MKLPFIEPDDDIYINISVLLIVISYLSTTKRGTLKLNNERLHIYDYLVRNPVKLYKFLEILGKKPKEVNHKDSYSVASISANVDPLFDRERLKSLLTLMISRNLVTVEYKNKEGFFYKLTESGNKKVKRLEGDFFSEVKLLCDQLQQTLSFNQSQVNNSLNQIMRMDTF
ncbi:TPA: ABC-three component system middle component 4 [Photobacterium damselae]